MIAGQEFFAKQKIKEETGEALFNIQQTDSTGAPLYETAPNGELLPVLVRDTTGVVQSIPRSLEITADDFDPRGFDQPGISHVLVPIYFGNEQKTDENGRKLFHVQELLNEQVSFYHEGATQGTLELTFQGQTFTINAIDLADGDALQSAVNAIFKDDNILVVDDGGDGSRRIHGCSNSPGNLGRPICLHSGSSPTCFRRMANIRTRLFQRVAQGRAGDEQRAARISRRPARSIDLHPTRK